MWGKLQILEIDSGFERTPEQLNLVSLTSSDFWHLIRIHFVNAHAQWSSDISPDIFHLVRKDTLTHTESIVYSSVALSITLFRCHKFRLCVFSAQTIWVCVPMKQNRSFRSSCATMTSSIVVRIRNQKWTFSRFSLALTEDEEFIRSHLNCGKIFRYSTFESEKDIIQR